MRLYEMMVSMWFRTHKKSNTGTTTSRIYLDHAASTPLIPDVRDAMRVYEDMNTANPSASHREGVSARQAIESARKHIAEVLHTTPRSIMCTSGGTESNNLAILGVVEAVKKKGRAYSDMEIITTAIEHPSILEPIRHLAERGVKVVFAPVDAEGRVVLSSFRSLMSSATILVSVGYANSEIGTVQDIKALSRAVRLFRDKLSKHTDATLYEVRYPLMHVDASQAPLWLSCRMDSLGIDLMTLDASKCGGPKASGILATRGNVPLSPILFGGGQEGGLRSGTEDGAKIIGLARALMHAQEGYEARASRVALLRDQFIDELQKAFPTLVVNGSREHRLANNANISIPGIDGEYAVIGLDHRGIGCSTRSACSTNESLEDGGSHVLRALGVKADVVLGAVRFSLSPDTTEAELTYTVRALMEHVAISRLTPASL
jgi:cysteine desulfurase